MDKPEDAFDAAMRLWDADRIEDAEEAALAGLISWPDSPKGRFMLGCFYEALGRWTEAWPLMEARLPLWVSVGKMIWPQLPFPMWKGEDLAGKRVLIYPEQGLGDQIQFARFAPKLAERGARVAILVPPVLGSLLGHLSNYKPSAIEDHDYWVMPGSLAGLLSVTQENLPNAAYLPAHHPVSATGRIGVMWQGNATQENDAHRSFPPETYKPLLDLKLQLVPLAPEHSGARTFADTARIIDQLDAVVTVDTAVAHLAGAMGRPVYLALPYYRTAPRWMRNRADTPWYPSVRLYRQGPDLNWTPVIEAIRDDLSKRYAGG